MISNEVMGIIGFLELHIYCALVLMILLPTTIIYNRKRNKGTNRYVVLVYLFFFVLIVCDMILMFLQSKGIGSNTCYYILRLGSYMSYTLSGYFWFMFCESEVNTILYKDKLLVSLFSIPVLAEIIVEVTNQSHRMLFSFDGLGNYSRNYGFSIIAVLNGFYLLFALVHMIYCAKMTDDELIKREYNVFAIVTITFIIACAIHFLTGINCLGIGATGGIAVLYQTITAGVSRREERRAKQREAFLKMDNESLAFAVGTVYTLAFSVNLTENKYHVLGHDGQMAIQIPQNGNHDDLIRGGMQNIPDREYQELFYETLYRENQIQAYKKGKKNLKLRYREMGADGKIHWIETVVIFMENTEDIEQITFVKNIDDEVAYENDVADAKKRAEDANRAKDNFLSSMSHDIRTPINGVIGMTEIAKLHMDEPDRIADCLVKIDTVSQHLLSLVNDVMDMNAIENGSVNIKNASMNLNDFAENCINIMHGQLLGRDIDFKSEINVEHADVLGDESHLKQAIINILGNAVKFTADGGRINFNVRELSCNNNKVRIRMTVSDTGKGMQPEFVKHIWDPFSQENSGARTNYKGTGLGMVITRRYVEMMQGVVYVDSEPGKGSTFTVDITFDIDQGIGSNNDRDKELLKDLTGARVLLVEDNELNQEIAKNLLEDFGMIVNTADDGRKAVDMFKASERGYYNLILMDIMMPIMDGLEASKEIRALKRDDAKDVIIIAMTANAFDYDIQKSLDAGMNAHLSKPIDVKKLKKVISDLI